VSNDKTARVWDAETGAPLTVFNGHDDPVNVVAFSPDGIRVVTASDDKTARIWNNPSIDAGDAFAIACVSLGHADLDDLAHYGLKALKPICGSNAPNKVDPKAFVD
jgi:WD40 repeat protein